MMLRVLKHLNEETGHMVHFHKPSDLLFCLLENGGASISKGQGAKPGKPGNHMCTLLELNGIIGLYRTILDFFIILLVCKMHFTSNMHVYSRL